MLTTGLFAAGTDTRGRLLRRNMIRSSSSNCIFWGFVRMFNTLTEEKMPTKSFGQERERERDGQEGSVGASKIGKLADRRLREEDADAGHNFSNCCMLLVPLYEVVWPTLFNSVTCTCVVRLLCDIEK